jgi:hypothetical protein
VIVFKKHVKEEDFEIDSKVCYVLRFPLTWVGVTRLSDCAYARGPGNSYFSKSNPKRLHLSILGLQD